MSFPYLDYLPCDLTLYAERILPAWRAAHDGQFEGLRELMASIHHISDWPQFNIPSPLPDKSFWRQLLESEAFYVYMDEENIWPPTLVPDAFPTRLYNEMLQEIEKANELDFWAFCSRHLPEFFGENVGTDPALLLLNHLFFTLCCQLPAEKMTNDSSFTGNEDIYLWYEYMSRSPDIAALWAPFYELAPQALADQILAPQTYREYLASKDQESPIFLPRALFLHTSYSRHQIMGFLDPQETVHLLTHLPLKERPQLEMIIDGCIRDGGQHSWPLSPELEQLWRRTSYGSSFYPHSYPPENIQWITDEQQIREIYHRMCAYWNENDPERFQESVDGYYSILHYLEAEMLARLRYAAARGWGIIKVAT